MTSAPRLLGHGRTLTNSPQDRYAALLARARGEYLSQLSLNDVLTARHGRHVVSSTLALLTPSLLVDGGAAPRWVSASSTDALLGLVGSGDARLLSGSTSSTMLHTSAFARLVWQRQSGVRGSS